MKDSIHKYFKVGTIQWMSYPAAQYDLLDSLKKLACDDFLMPWRLHRLKVKMSEKRQEKFCVIAI